MCKNKVLYPGAQSSSLTNVIAMRQALSHTNNLRKSTKTVAVRLEGGIGDHILGMRLLPFIREKYPDHRIEIFSDCGGSRPQMEISSISPYVAGVTAVYKNAPMIIDPASKPVDFDHSNCYDALNNFNQLRRFDQELISKADIYFDAWGESFFAVQARVLGVSPFEILNTRSRLQTPQTSVVAADHMLRHLGQKRFVTLHLAKYGADFLHANIQCLSDLLRQVLVDEEIIILNVFQTEYGFSDIPEPWRRYRRQQMIEEARVISSLTCLHRRIVTLSDLPILTVAGIIQRSHYFIGVDNGIKHLAWAMNKPLSYFLFPSLPTPYFLLRWLPDFDRALTFQSGKEEFEKHLRDIACHCCNTNEQNGCSTNKERLGSSYHGLGS